MLWMVWSGAISIANSLLLWVFFARLRDVEELGRFTIVMGLYALFYGICSLGLIPYIVSEIAKRNEQNDVNATGKNERKVAEFISTASIFLLFTGVACAVLMGVCGFLVSESWAVRVSALILSFAMIPTGVINVGEASAIAFGRTRLVAFATTFENVLRTFVPFVLIWFGASIPVICISFVLVRIAALLIYGWDARPKIKHFSFNKSDFIIFLKVSPTFGGTMILASVNLQAVILLLGFFSTEVESAKYGVASRFLIPVSILMASYASVIQPVFTQFAHKSIENAGSYLSKMASYPLILSVLAAVASPFLSNQVLTVFFGENYSDASTTLDILAISVVPFCIVMIVARGLVAINAQHIDFFANAVSVAVCFLAALFFIPRYGAIGAAIAQLFSFLSMSVVETVYLSKRLISFRIWQKASLSSLFFLTIYVIILEILIF